MKRRLCAALVAFAVIIGSSLTVVPKTTVTASYVDDFLATVGPMCTNDMRENKILASFTMAQAIYESGWGRSTLAVEANNLFGMRAYSSWTGKVYDRNEGVLYSSWSALVSKKGSTYVSNYSMSFWRAFDSWQESVYSHSELFNSSDRYANLRGNYDYKSCCKLVVEDGYCTDSGYTENLIGLIESYNLEQYNYDFAANGEDGTVTPDEKPTFGENLFAGINVSYFLKGKWAEFSGSTKLATDGKYRGDSSNNWNGNSAVSGVTFDTADYNSANATVNFFTFELAEAADIATIAINGYRENGNRNYATLEVFVSDSAVSVNADNFETITSTLTKLDYTLEKKVIDLAPDSAGDDQFFDLYLTFDVAEGVKSVLIKTNANYATNGFFQFDEIAAYAPLNTIPPFTFAEGVDESFAAVDTENGFLTVKSGVITAESLMSRFCDIEMSVSDAGGNLIADTAPVGTGHTITTTVNKQPTSLVVVVNGDINGDCLISALDYIAMGAYLKSLAALEGAPLLACDIDYNNKVAAADYIALKQKLKYKS